MGSAAQGVEPVTGEPAWDGSTLTADDLLVVVPARGGSKRLPGKNLRMLGGKPLLCHTIDFLRAEGLLHLALLSTDSADIAATAERHGLTAPFLRPAAISGDSATTLTVVIHAMEHVRRTAGRSPALVAVLQVTSPFRHRGLLAAAIARMRREPSIGSIVAMTKLHVSGRYAFRQDASGALSPVTEDDAPLLVPTGSLFLTRTEHMLAQQSLYAAPLHHEEVGAYDATDIDTLDDFKIAEALHGAVRPAQRHAASPGK